MDIGILDSGSGGVSILDHISSFFGRVLYFSDALCAPYGEKKESFILDRVSTIFSWMWGQGVQRMFLGCHTASYVMKKHCIADVHDMIYPAVNSILEKSVRRGLVVLCTPLTARLSHVLESELRQRGFTSPVFFVPCPGLSDLIEKCFWTESVSLFESYLSTVKSPFDGIVYGCTHYALLDSYLPESVKDLVINPADHVTDLFKAERCADVQGVLVPVYPPQKTEMSFYCTKKDSFLGCHLDKEYPISYVSEKQLGHHFLTQKKGLVMNAVV